MKLRFAFAWLVLLGVVGSAPALTFKADYKGLFGVATNVRFNEFGPKYVNAGILTWDRYIGAGFNQYVDTKKTFCIDISTYITDPGYFTEIGTGSLTAGDLPTGITVSEVDLAARYLQTYWTWAQASTTNAAALQMAIWSSLYGGISQTGLYGTGGSGYDIENLAVRTAYASIWGTTLKNESSIYWKPDPQFGTNQAQITYDPTGGSSGDPVPEPFTMGLVGAAVLAAMRRRRRKA